MTLVIIEMRKWKRSKMVWCVLGLTLLLGLFAIDRTFSVSRSSPIMDSFGDLYTLAFKNLSSLFLPIVLGVFAAALFFDEQKNNTLKELLVIPVTRSQLYFSKVAVMVLLSAGLCLITFIICVLGGLITGDFPDMNAETLLQAAFLFLAGGVLTPIAMLPIVFLAALSKGYVLPIGATLLYLVPAILAPSILAGIHPLSSVLGVCSNISGAAAEMARSWAGGTEIALSPVYCLLSLILVGIAFAIASVFTLRKQSY